MSRGIGIVQGLIVALPVIFVLAVVISRRIRYGPGMMKRPPPRRPQQRRRHRRR